MLDTKIISDLSYVKVNHLDIISIVKIWVYNTFIFTSYFNRVGDDSGPAYGQVCTE